MELTALIPLLMSAVVQTNSLPWLNAPPVLQESDRSTSNYQVVQSRFTQTDSLANANWQVVPGAEVGRHPVETSMDVNHIVRTGNTVTFDVTGYRGAYYRLQGNCDGSDVYFLRRGLLERAGARYEQVNDRTISVTDWHYKLLDYACNLSPQSSLNDRKSSLLLAQATSSEYGTIEGTLAFPADDYVPALTVCAQSTSNYYLLNCIKTEESQKTFKLSVRPGEYFVFSYMANAMRDGNTGRMYDVTFYYAERRQNSEPIPVQVRAGSIVSNVAPRASRCMDSTPAYCVTPPN